MSDEESKIDEMNKENINTYAILKTSKSIIKITELPFTIGRNALNHLKIDNLSISKNHAKISFDDLNENFIIIDTSSNGTYVNETMISNDKMNLYSGDTLRFGNDKEIYVFEKMTNNEETVIFPNSVLNKNKISLVNYNIYQPSKINHLFGDNNKKDIKDTLKSKKSKNQNNELFEENERLKLENTNLKEKLNLQERNYFVDMNNKLDDINDKIIYNNTVSDKEINNNYDVILIRKIKNELIPEWERMSINELSEKIDIIIENYKQKIDFNNIILSLESQYNSEVSTFNYILQNYDKKLQEIFTQIEEMLRNNSNDKRDVTIKYLTNQLSDLVNQRESNLITINKLKGELIKLQTSITLEKAKKNYKNYNNEKVNNDDLMLINKKLGKIENQLKSINQISLEKQKELKKNSSQKNINSPNPNLENQMNFQNSTPINYQNYNIQPMNYSNYNSFQNRNFQKKEFNEPSFNKFFAETLNELNQKNKQINVLNSKLSKIKNKYTIDANNIYKNELPDIYNKEENKMNFSRSSNNSEKKDIILENVMDNKRFEEILKQKESLFKKK